MKLKSLQATAVTVAAGFALASCAGGDIDEPAMTEHGPSSGTTTAASTESQEKTEASTSNDTRAAAAVEEQPAADGFSTEPTDTLGDHGPGGQLRTTDIRAGSHDGFDRVVFEFEGEGLPTYNAAYTNEPREQGSGFPMEFPGATALELFVHGTSLDMDPDAKYASDTNLGLNTGNIADVVYGGTFEADSHYLVGLDSKRPYKAYVLENPTRLVVDIQK
ncbi:hypothetical protein M3G18_00215 [Corynebacterium sp. p3-SID1145]|uniref:AMIN-like domain-containing (lipo)protein n=1 Tax=unclassified Corynebacterium TaxID=2624378 RepID=UPI0021AA1595|nr:MULTISPECIES: hypothetical protein [unclassified Corynebacterium]MCT1451349.1 hypothetical protein [Corynebacterium sp. p3-SID1145]MCT1460643.1 hypothetical protein [Corynebacterium sp. p3-SID1140]